MNVGSYLVSSDWGVFWVFSQKTYIYFHLFSYAGCITQRKAPWSLAYGQEQGIDLVIGASRVEGRDSHHSKF